MSKIKFIVFLIFLNLVYIYAINTNELYLLKNKVESGEISEEEAVIQAKALGLTQDQIDKAKLQYAPKATVNEQKNPEPVKDTTTNFWKTKNVSEVPQINIITNKIDNPDKLKNDLPDNNNKTNANNGLITPEGYFGYGLFQNSKAEYVALQDGPVDPNYRLGPGDEIIVSVWGDVEFRNSLTVSRDGSISVDKIGLVIVNGLSLKDLEKKLINIFSKVYSTINSPNPSTFLDVTLGKLKPITIFFVGEIKNPGAHQVSSYSTAFNALYSAGGPTLDGSLRKIQVIRNGVTITELDLYDYMLTGKKIKDVRLEHGDHIFIPTRETTITLNGEVRYPAVYELIKNETMADLVKYAGGLKTTADLDRVQIERIIPFNKRKDNKKILDVQDYNLSLATSDQTIINPIKLFDRDAITVYKLLDLQKGWVTIEGAIFRPGKYAIDKGMTVRQLISQAQDVLPEAYLDKIDITRTFLSGKTEYLSLSLNDKSADTTILQDFDNVKIYSIWDLRKRNKEVQISGHIGKPGNYLFIDSMRVLDLITKAGGLSDPYYKKSTYLTRADLITYNEDELTTKIVPIRLDSLLAGSKNYNYLLKHRDKLIIYSIDVIFNKPKVTIVGAVKKPGNLDLQTNMTLHDLILQADGFQRNAYKYEIEVYRIDPYNIKKDSLAIVHKIIINPKLLSNFRTQNDFKLKDLDFVVVREHPDFQLQNAVTIAGQVKFPGTYVLLHKNESFNEIIKRAGGLKEEAFIDGITLKRNGQDIGADFKSMLKGWWSSNDLIMMNGDRLDIPQKPNTVLIDGFVNRPCYVQYREDWSLDDYLDAAGGYKAEENMEHSSTMVTYASGISKRDGWFFSPKIYDGSTIMVNAVKTEKKSSIETLKEWASILGSSATVLVTIVLLTR